MHIKIKKTGFLLLLAMTCAACYDDLGNYDYHEINEVEIGNIEDKYTVMLGENLLIDPSLDFTLDEEGDPGRYSFEWFLIDESAETQDERQTLGTEKVLDLVVSLSPATYPFYFEVTDTETDVTFRKSFSVTVESQIGQGWLVLNEVNGGSRLDMVPLLNGEYSVIHDVLAEVGSSLVLSGTPIDITCVPKRDYYAIYVSTTGNGTTRIHPETFDWEPTYQIAYDMLDGTLPTDFAADAILPIVGGSFTAATVCYVYKDGNIYWGAGYYYDTPLNNVKAEVGTFRASRYSARVYADGYLFDEDKRRIVYQRSGALSCETLKPGSLFDFNDIGMDLVYMGATLYNGREIFAIMKVPDQNTYYLARFGADVADQRYYQEMSATDIEQATHFGVSPEYGYIFYNAGGKVYEYDFSLKTSKLMLDVGPKQITYLSCGYYFTAPGNVPVDNQREVVIGIYDPTGPEGSNGVLEVYDVPPVNGDLELKEHYEGFGKIVDVAYRQRP